MNLIDIEVALTISKIVVKETGDTPESFYDATPNRGIRIPLF